MHWVEVRDPKRALGWSHYADPGLAPLRRSGDGLAGRGWLHYGDPGMEP